VRAYRREFIRLACDMGNQYGGDKYRQCFVQIRLSAFDREGSYSTSSHIGPCAQYQTLKFEPKLKPARQKAQKDQLSSNFPQILYR
jgi:hypothetical protein